MAVQVILFAGDAASVDSQEQIQHTGLHEPSQILKLDTECDHYSLLAFCCFLTTCWAV